MLNPSMLGSSPARAATLLPVNDMRSDLPGVEIRAPCGATVGSVYARQSGQADSMGMTMLRATFTICGVLFVGAALAGCQTDAGAGRQDVQEISEPPPAEGPADPDPACGPDNPEC